MILKLKSILSNPNRDLKANPLDADKITELVSSINTTGFWDNVVVRNNKDGKYELAYGHHRLAAALAAGLTEADFIVKNLDDELMIKVMDNENRETYGTSPLSLIESVRAVVKGLAEGRVRPFEVDPKVRKDVVRYAPSFVPGTDVGRTSPQMAYTSLDIANFLGRTRAKDSRRIKPEDSIVAALDALHLMEMGHLKNTELFKEKLVRAPEGKDATVVKVPLSTNELLTLASERKRDVVAVQERRGKTQAELDELREKQLAAQQKAKDDEKKAEEDRKAYLKKEADARREENYKQQEKLAQARKDADERAKAKEELNKKRLKELEETIAKKKLWEAEQRIEDDYRDIRRDVESLIRSWETKVSEHDAEREQVKSLAKRRALRPADRLRLRKAAVAVADHYSDWVAAQFAPLPTEKAELKMLAKRETSKRDAEKRSNEDR